MTRIWPFLGTPLVFCTSTAELCVFFGVSGARPLLVRPRVSIFSRGSRYVHSKGGDFTALHGSNGSSARLKRTFMASHADVCLGPWAVAFGSATCSLSQAGIGIGLR